MVVVTNNDITIGILIVVIDVNVACNFRVPGGARRSILVCAITAYLIVIYWFTIYFYYVQKQRNSVMYCGMNYCPLWRGGWTPKPQIKQ